jgi:hypothetical protein
MAPHRAICAGIDRLARYLFCCTDVAARANATMADASKPPASPPFRGMGRRPACIRGLRPWAEPSQPGGAAERERRAVVEHVARFRFRYALLAHGRRRQDRDRLEAAETLALEHVAGDRPPHLPTARYGRASCTKRTTENGLRSVAGPNRRP